MHEKVFATELHTMFQIYGMFVLIDFHANSYTFIQISLKFVPKGP